MQTTITTFQITRVIITHLFYHHSAFCIVDSVLFVCERENQSITLKALFTIQSLLKVLIMSESVHSPPRLIWADYNNYSGITEWSSLTCCSITHLSALWILKIPCKFVSGSFTFSEYPLVASLSRDIITYLLYGHWRSALWILKLPMQFGSGRFYIFFKHLDVGSSLTCCTITQFSAWWILRKPM